MLVELVSQMLAALGYDAHGFGDAREALEALREDRPGFAAVLADRSMPGMGGLDLVQELRKFRATLPFVLVTGLHDPSLEASYAKLGVSSVLTKPFSSAELAAHLERALGGDPDLKPA